MNSILDDIDVENNLFNDIYPNLKSTECSKYYQINQYNQLNINPHSDLLLLSFNIRSLSANFDLFNGFSHLLDKKFDIMCFTESWLKDSNKCIYNMEGYNDFHNLRNNDRRGGGISVYVSNSYNTKLISKCTIIEKYIETLFIEISEQNKKILVATIYKPNKSDDNLFIEKLISLINSCARNNYDEIVLNGDFNFDLFKQEENGVVLKFLNSLSSVSLIPVITKPTRITDQTATLIDNIFISNPINFTSGIIISDISDHYPIFINIKDIFSNKSDNPNMNIKFRLINDENSCNFYLNVSSYDFSAISDSNDCASALDNLTTIIDHEYKSCFPLKTKTISYKDHIKPWISKDIVSYIKKRHHYYILYRKNIMSKKAYCDYRNFVSSKIKMAKKKFYEEKFNLAKNNIKETWKIINNVLKPKQKNRKNVINKIIVNDEMHSDVNYIANSFNNFFINIGKTITESVEDHDPEDHKNYLNNLDLQNSFFFKPVIPTEISTIISSLKNKPSNINTTPVKILKLVRNIISTPLANIINKSLTSGNFPNSLKIARVTPIYKEGSKTDTNNYRPISVLPTMSKIFEKVVHKQLYTYLEINSLLDQNQFGFREKRSTTHAILNFLQYLYKNIDSNKIIISIFLDFRKAFDSVDHNILLSKLKAYGIRGHALDWFQSYLSNRMQYVCLNDVNSDLKPIKYGVPQGSILGPLLFLIFINDISKCSNLFKCILYADDSTLSSCISVNDLDESTKLLNNELNNVYKWLCANKITINKKKTQYMIFSYNKNIMTTDIKIGKNIILETDYTKFLGLFLDNHLTFKYHINEISKKLSKSVGLLYKLNKFLPQKALKIIYSSLINPYITYGIEAWHGTYKNYTNKIFVLQKKAIRAVNSLEYNEHTNDYFKFNRILKLEDQYKLQLSNYTFKILNTSIDNEISLQLKSQIRDHSHDTRNRDMFSVAHVNKSRSKNSLFYNGVKVWNSIPNPIKNANSLYKFKKLSKEFYLHKY